MSKKACVISSYAYIDENINYGALLQYYALEKVLLKENVKAYWLRYMLSHSLQDKVKLFVKKRIYAKETKEINICLDSFKKFISKYCDVSDAIYKNEKQLVKNCPIADVYITGSDQVWGGTLAPNYLTFVPDNRPKISYAASFGKNEISDEQKRIITPWLKRFNFISVREDSGVKICDSIGIDAVQVLDPTLLIEAKDYPVVDNHNCSDIYGYFLNFNSLEELYWDNIMSFSYENCYSVKVACTNQTYKKFPDEYVDLPTPEEWLAQYANAKYIITNTFHGTVFAIVFRKPFLVIKQQGDGKKQNGRVQSLLENLNLEERYFSKELSIEKQINKEIDWKSIEKKLDSMRKSSLEYLAKSTNKS